MQLSQLHCQDEQREGQTKGVRLNIWLGPSDEVETTFVNFSRVGQLKGGRLIESQPSFTQPTLTKAIVGVVGVGKWPKVGLGMAPGGCRTSIWSRG